MFLFALRGQYAWAARHLHGLRRLWRELTRDANFGLIRPATIPAYKTFSVAGTLDRLLFVLYCPPGFAADPVLLHALCNLLQIGGANVGQI